MPPTTTTGQIEICHELTVIFLLIKKFFHPIELTYLTLGHYYNSSLWSRPMRQANPLSNNVEYPQGTNNTQV